MEWLPKTRTGKAISAFALTEPGSGSDVAATASTAVADGNGFVLNGEKTWISNGGIADVYTVFARTGDAFGADTFGVVPDIMNLAKALTNGTVPMGAVLTTADIYDAFVDDELPDHMIGLPHGYTYSGHPVACAAALAALDVFEHDGMVERSLRLAPVLEEALHGLKGLPHVTDIRNIGMAGALQIEARDGDPLVRPYEMGVRCYEEGLYVRWGGDTLQFAPPFTATVEDLENMHDILKRVISTVS